MIKYSGVILIINVIGVFGHPQCYNWCPTNVGYGCCDHYSGGYYTGHVHYPPNINNGLPGIQQIPPPLYCPAIDCSKPPTIVRVCTDDNDCLRKEKCCTNPCDNGRKACIDGVTTAPLNYYCPTVDNCRTWFEENQNVTTCSSNDDCKRADTCCTVPCRTDKVCLKTKTSVIHTNCQFGGHC